MAMRWKALEGTTFKAAYGMYHKLPPPELVVESYANIDELTEKTRAQDRAAAELGLVADVRTTAGTISIGLRGNEQARLPTSLIVYARNSTRAELDSKAELSGIDGIYEGAIALPDNAYDLRIEDRFRRGLHGRKDGSPLRRGRKIWIYGNLGTCKFPELRGEGWIGRVGKGK